MKLVLFLVAMSFGALSIASNLEVQPLGEAALQNDRGGFYYADFGNVQINRRVSNMYQLKNTGTADITFKDDVTWGMDFRSRHNCHGTLKPSQVCRIEITFWPAFEGPARGSFRMSFNEEAADIDVDLRGYGVRR